jgi:glycosyltransferase involved in cell wall biosynthesis
VLHLIAAANRISGGEKSIFSMLEKMPRDQVHFRVLFIVDGRAGATKYIASQEADKRGLPFLNCESSRRIDFKLLYSIRKTIKENQVHILHCHGYKADIYGCLAALNTGIKTVSTLHGWLGSSMKMNLYEKMDWFFDKFFVDKVITVSNAYQNKLIQMGIPSRKIVSIPNTINLDDLNSKCNAKDFRKQWNINPSHKVVGIIGRLAREKAHEIFIRSCAGVLKAFTNVTFVIVGEGYRLKELKDMVFALGLGKRIIFTGYQDDIASVYHALDLVVLTSVTEGLPVSLLEAGSMRKPVVATDAGGVSEVIVNAQTGFVVPVNDTEAITDKILRILNDGSLAETFGRNGQRFVRENFSPEAVCNKTVGLYREMMQSYH